MKNTLDYMAYDSMRDTILEPELYGLENLFGENAILNLDNVAITDTVSQSERFDKLYFEAVILKEDWSLRSEEKLLGITEMVFSQEQRQEARLEIANDNTKTKSKRLFNSVKI